MKLLRTVSAPRWAKNFKAKIILLLFRITEKKLFLPFFEMYCASGHIQKQDWKGIRN